MTLHIIFKRVQLIVLTLFYGLTMQAQTIEKYGTFFDDAIPVVLSGNRSIFTDKRNTGEKHLGHTIITTSVIFPLKEMSIAIRKERLYIISSTYPHRGISLSIIGKQTIQQDRVILPSMY